MSTSFFKINGTDLDGRLTVEDQWTTISSDLAGSFIGKAVTKRTWDKFNLNAETALLIEKDLNHPDHTLYWESVNALTLAAIAEMEECLRTLKAQ